MNKLNFVVFGITSNLAQIKLIPALFDLWKKGVLGDFKITGLSYKARSEAELRSMLLSGLLGKANEDDLKNFYELFEFVNGDFGGEEIYYSLKNSLESVNETCQESNLIYFLATHPDYYKAIFAGLRKVGLSKKRNGWVRLMIEKPLGKDEESAKELNGLLGQYFDEDQIYRIDHYLGKETIQNILAFRFNNDFLEKGLNRDTVDHIQVTMAETEGVEDRIGFYDNTGALKDVAQNHILQMMAISMMDQPKKFDNENITKARVNFFDNLEVDSNSLVLGQYDGYPVAGSKTNTYFAFRTCTKTGKFARVPIYARGGKKLAQGWTEIAFVLKNDSPVKNILIYRIKPNEGIILTVGVKKPGYRMEVQEGSMQFCFKSLNANVLNPYEKLIIDVVNGDPTFFNDAIEVEKQWHFIDSLSTRQAPLFSYKPGSWGPTEADEMMRKDGREWLEPGEEYCKL